ncbi:Antitoxin type II toxin-antitoxin system, type II toxin-antitoxin system [compost metagenome]
MRVVNFSDARNNLKKVIDDVVDDADFTVISRRDAPDAVLLSLDSFNSLMETVHLLKSPANAAHLARSLAQMESGKTVVRGLVEDDEPRPRKIASTAVSAKTAAKKARATTAAKPAKAVR